MCANEFKRKSNVLLLALYLRHPQLVDQVVPDPAKGSRSRCWGPLRVEKSASCQTCHRHYSPVILVRFNNHNLTKYLLAAIQLREQDQKIVGILRVSYKPSLSAHRSHSSRG